MRNAAAQANAESAQRAAVSKATDALGELQAIHKTLRAILKELRHQGKPHIKIKLARWRVPPGGIVAPLTNPERGAG